jgi:hypothetical protein
MENLLYSWAYFSFLSLQSEQSEHLKKGEKKGANRTTGTPKKGEKSAPFASFLPF